MADEGRVPERGKDRGCVPLACCWDGAGCVEKWSLGVLEGWGVEQTVRRTRRAYFSWTQDTA